MLLTLAFPRLRIIWSSSPYQTASIFQSLKTQNPEPNPIAAVRIGLDADETAGDQTFNQMPQDMLRHVPGITAKNLKILTLEVDSLKELANMEEDEVSEMIGKEAGRQVHRFFNKCVLDG